MRIVFVVATWPPEFRDASTYLEQFPLHRVLPQLLVLRGHEVHLIQLFEQNTSRIVDGVHYHFVRAPLFTRVAADMLSGVSGRPSHTFLALPEIGHALEPDVVHFHGTQLHLNLALVKARYRDARLVLHYHGGFPPRFRGVRAVQRRNFDAADALLFTSDTQADAFIAAGILRHPDKVFELVETSSTFRQRTDAQRLSGRPAFVSACRLHPIKDPLTTVKGFERILEFYQEAELHHFYRTDELLPELRAYVSRRTNLQRCVHFHGSRPYEEMEAIFNGADVLLQASVREFSGCAVLDAMACGVIPVLSDIPPFRRITGDARVGKLFEPGNPDALAACVRDLSDLPRRKAAVQAYFDQELSFEAMAERLEVIYTRVMQKQ